MPADLPRNVSRCHGAVVRTDVGPGVWEPMLCEPCRICRRRVSLVGADDGLYWFAVPPAVQYHGNWVCGAFIAPAPHQTSGVDA